MSATVLQGLLSVGFFMNNDPISDLNGDNVGLFHGGSAYSLGIQTLTAVCIIAWCGGIAFIILGVCFSFDLPILVFQALHINYYTDEN